MCERWGEPTSASLPDSVKLVERKRLLELLQDSNARQSLVTFLSWMEKNECDQIRCLLLHYQLLRLKGIIGDFDDKQITLTNEPDIRKILELIIADTYFNFEAHIRAPSSALEPLIECIKEPLNGSRSNLSDHVQCLMVRMHLKISPV